LQSQTVVSGTGGSVGIGAGVEVGAAADEVEVESIEAVDCAVESGAPIEPEAAGADPEAAGDCAADPQADTETAAARVRARRERRIRAWSPQSPSLSNVPRFAWVRRRIAPLPPPEHTSLRSPDLRAAAGAHSGAYRGGFGCGRAL
jgi:hypothetical protein